MYISFNPYVPCMNVILTNYMQNITFCHTALPCTIARLEVLLITKKESICKTYYMYSN